MDDPIGKKACENEETAAAPYPSGPTYLPSATQTGAPAYLPSGMPISEAPPPNYNQATYQMYQQPTANWNSTTNRYVM